MLRVIFGSKKASKIRRAKWWRCENLNEKVVGCAIIAGIITGIGIDIYFTETAHVVYAEEMATTTPERQEVRIEIVWDTESIIAEIRKTFPEDPETAVKIARCESGFRPTQQSNHILSYGREQSFGIFQIHAPDWHDTALRLGYDKYQSDVEDNLKMARYIYDNYGWKPWSCYTKKMI